MIVEEEEYLAHYGILRKSGRYPWGSGGALSSSKNNKGFLDYIADLRSQGIGDTDIAKGLGLTTTEFRDLRSIANNRQKQSDISYAQRLKEKGMSNVEIGKKMGRNESSVRALLSAGLKDKADILTTTANMLREQVETRGFIDVGTGAELHVGVSLQKLKAAVTMLREDGYSVHNVQIDQVGTNQKTVVKVLAPKGTTYRDIVTQKDKIKFITAWSDDGGRTMFGITKPKDISSKRVGIVYAEQGGADADGVIYVRRGVKDVSLDGSRYAQVRISVDGTHYIKGMAMYKDNLPAGVDVVFNTNKSNTGNKLDALKPQKTNPDGSIDTDNPFGAVIGRQIGKKNAKGEMELSSVMNIVNEEGNWEKWSRTLSSQMLSKQRPVLVKTQLDHTYETRQNQLDEIRRMTNPVVRKKLLDDFAEDVDSAAVHLKASAIKGQGTHVILPVKSMKDTEIFAPNYDNGTRVVLIRFPHGGIFEIPELTVNNNQPEAKRTIGSDAKDAVGISAKVASRLSGADFDGDTVLVIPNKQSGPSRVITSPALEGLKNFDPQTAYPGYDGMKKMSSSGTQAEMGKISNLITDMTIKGASMGELAQAVRHSMVVIDAEKKGLNYKESEQANGIKHLREKYQRSVKGGASTLISNSGATSTVDIPKRKQRGVDRKTGEKVFVETGESYVDKKTGKVVVKVEKVPRLSVNDARSYSSGRQVETLYADHSNRLKTMANQARKESVNTPTLKRSPSAAKAYAPEVQRLDAALNLALRNRPLERQAQIIAAANVDAKKKANPDMDKGEIKKLNRMALEEARARMGAGKERIVISEREWEAVQAGAISPSRLKDILDNADLETVKKLATPRVNTVMTSTKQKRAATMLASGYTQAEVAAALGVSLSTLKSSIYSEDG